MVPLKINHQGQITIPTEIQEQLGLLPGTEVQMEVVGDALQLRKQPGSNRGTLLIQIIRGKATTGLTSDEIMRLTRREE